jgi:hypothetical protein
VGELIFPAIRIVIRPLVFGFAVLAGYFVAWGLVFCVDAVTRAFFGTLTGAVGWIPFAGKVIKTPLLAVQHKLTSYLGGLEAHFDRQMAARWHAFASLVSQLAADTRAAAIFDYQIARRYATLWGNAAVAAIVARAHAVSHAVGARVHAVTQVVTRIEKVITTKADVYVVRKVRAIAAQIAHTVEWDIPLLRRRERALTDSVGRLWHRVKSRERALGLGAVTALFVAAIGRLGLGWIRCRNVGRVGRNVCGMNPGLLESLLADSLLIVGAISIVELARELQRITPDVVDGVRFAIRETQ